MPTIISRMKAVTTTPITMPRRVGRFMARSYGHRLVSAPGVFAKPPPGSGETGGQRRNLAACGLPTDETRIS